MKDVTAGKDRQPFIFFHQFRKSMKRIVEGTDRFKWLPGLRFYLISTGSIEFEWGRSLHTIVIFDIFKNPEL